MAVERVSQEGRDARVEQAQHEGVLRCAAQQSDALAGYGVFFADPDGNMPELSYGQPVGMEINMPRNAAPHPMN